MVKFNLKTLNNSSQTYQRNSAYMREDYGKFSDSRLLLYSIYLSTICLFKSKLQLYRQVCLSPDACAPLMQCSGTEFCNTIHLIYYGIRALCFCLISAFYNKSCPLCHQETNAMVASINYGKHVQAVPIGFPYCNGDRLWLVWAALVVQATEFSTTENTILARNSILTSTLIETDQDEQIVLTSAPYKFNGEDKGLKFKTWAKSVEH